MNLITGRTGTDHVLARHDALIHQTLFGASDFVLNTGYFGDNNLIITQIDSSNIKIGTGYLIMQGRLCEVPSEETIALTPCSSANLKKKIVIAAEYSIDDHGIESVDLISIEGAASSNMYIEPTITYEKGEIDSGEKHQMPLYAVYMDGFALKTENDKLIYDKLYTVKDTTPIQSALDYAVSNVSNITSMLNTLSTNVYSHLADLMEGISQGIKGQWKNTVAVNNASSAIAVNMGSSYTYSASDVIDVYLNGLKATSAEYSVTGSSSTINVTITASTFTGQMEVVATKIVEEA